MTAVKMADTVASKIELFGKWSYDDVEITDISLEDYIAVNKKYCVYLPHTAGRYARKRFRKVCLSPFREHGHWLRMPTLALQF